jgi:hypothetical protein
MSNEFDGLKGQMGAESVLDYIIDGDDWLLEEEQLPNSVIEQFLDVGDKFALIGASKARKSFMALQLMLSVAAGRDFLGWRIPQPRRVLLVQYEINKLHFHARLKRMARALGIEPGTMNHRIKIINARGVAGFVGEDSIVRLREVIDATNPELIFLDPLYKLSAGDEKSNGDDGMKPLLAEFDKIVNDYNASLGFCHHDTKGSQANKQNTDRGSGGGILARDYDAALILTPHAVSPDLIVLDSVNRNYKAMPSRTVSWTETATGGYCFQINPDVAATRQTDGKVKPPTASFVSYVEKARDMLKKGPVDITVFKENFRIAVGLGEHKVDAFVKWGQSIEVGLFKVIVIRGKGIHKSTIELADTETQNNE